MEGRRTVVIGYYTWFTGGLTISPPIDEEDYKAFHGDEGGFFTFEQVPGDEDVQIVNGEITVVGQTAGHTELNIYFEESVKGYNFDEQLNQLVEKAKAEGRVVEGAIYGDGEESDDFWCASVTNNVIASEGGSVVYPSERYSAIAELGKKPRAHGNVIPRPDGKRRTCLETCVECGEERAFLIKLLYGG